MHEGFTGLYTKYYYYIKWGVFLFRHREGTYDYYSRNNREWMCGFRKETNLEGIFLSPSITKFYLKLLNHKEKR